MAKYYVNNLETGKLNVYTGGKSDWLSLPEAQRNDIKRACLWSSRSECWVSRGKVPSWNTISLTQALTAAGFEDRGTEGEKLSFAEQVEAKQEKAADRAERSEARAEKAEQTSNALFKRSHDMMDAIPMGQPILVGHYSEGRDRRYRERAWNTLGKAVAESDKAKYYEHKAALAQDTASGSEYSDPRYLGNRIKEVEKDIRALELCLQGKSYVHSEPKAISDEYRERVNGLMAEKQDKLAFFRDRLANCGVTVYDKAALKGKSEVKIRGRWEPIVRLNPTTVAVPNICFPLPEHQRKYALKYAYTEVQDTR